MVALIPNLPESFCFNPIGMAALPNLPAFSSAPAGATPSTNSSTQSSIDDPSKKVRKPYTITKSRESWTEPEHDKFLEALQLFDRDWKKIEAFIGSKTVIQIRSHAQKYFLKVQKSGANEHLPPPRPKRKAAHPYPQKASKSAPMLPLAASAFQDSPSLSEQGFVQRPESSGFQKVPFTVIPPWSGTSPGAVNLLQEEKANVRSDSPVANNYCCSSDERDLNSKTWPGDGMTDQGNHGPHRVLPDFAQVYSFIGSVFDPSITGHVQKLKNMDPIDVETVLLLMRNLSVNLSSPDFEDHRRLLSCHENEMGKFNSSANVMQSQPASQHQ